MSELRRLAKAFAIVGFEGDRLIRAVERYQNDDDEIVDEIGGIVDPDVLFLYPHDDDETRNILVNIIETKFGRPLGYQILTKAIKPDFRTIRHTDRQYRITYLSVFTFYEAARKSSLYVPKFLVAVSDAQFSDLFKTCLRALYEKMALEDADVDFLNRAIATIVHYRLPVPGATSQLSLGFGEPLTVHSPTAKLLPKTGLTVYSLIRTLGLENTVKAFVCLLCQLQVTMYSADVSFLTDSCEAMLALLYPFEYCFIYASVQTKRCLERYKTLENPTPFFIGICEPPEDVLQDVADKVVLVDLDNKYVRLPKPVESDTDGIDKTLIDQLLIDLRSVFLSKIYVEEQKAVRVDVARANIIEKRLRACFLRFHATLICDYRQSLCVVRFYPQPRVFFDKAHFFGKRHLKYQTRSGNGRFLSNFVDVFLEQVLQERKLPVREADFFDELCALLCGFTGEKLDSAQLIDDIAKYLLENDRLAATDSDLTNKNSAPVSQRPLPAVRQFPSPNRTRIAKFSYDLGLNKNRNMNDSMSDSPAKRSACRHGRIATGYQNRSQLANVHLTPDVVDRFQDRTALYNAYIACIFAKEFKKAKSVLPNINKAIQAESIEVRRRIPTKLLQYSQSQSIVDSKQFSKIGNLVHTLLAMESPWDENGIAAAVLPLLRNVQLCDNRQFLYTAVQRMPVWRNESFWVALACRHIAADISARYENRSELDLENEPCRSLDVLARFLEKGQPSSQTNEASEEAVALTWCKHFADVMICFLVEFDTCHNSSNSSKGNDSGISIESDYCSPAKTPGQTQHPSVEYHVIFAVEEICKEANLPVKCLQAVKAEIAEKINEHVKYIRSLKLKTDQDKKRLTFRKNKLKIHKS